MRFFGDLTSFCFSLFLFSFPCFYVSFFMSVKGI